MKAVAKRKKDVPVIKDTVEIEASDKSDRCCYLDEVLERARRAAQAYEPYSQEQVDKIVEETALAGANARILLAELAAEETGMGVVVDKVIKNHFATEYIYNQIRKIRTCGVIYEDKLNRVKTIAHPVGVVIAVIPVTNPTSTAMFKALSNLKARNAVIFAPHPRAAHCTAEAVRIMRKAALEAGAPEDILQVIDNPSVEDTAHLMANGDLILATGGPSMVKAAYKSGKPALGVGAGNTPAYFHHSVDLTRAVEDLIKSKTFDNGVVCACEASLSIDQKIFQQTLDSFLERGCYLISEEEAAKVADLIASRLGEICGQSAEKIARLAGFKVPKSTKILLVRGNVKTIAWSDPLAREKLSPILTLYKVSGKQEAVEVMNRLLTMQGMGHTAVIHAQDQEAIKFVTEKLPVGRMLINQPASQGAIGDIYNFGLTPSLTLGCGSWGGNSISGNVNVVNLLNIITVADRHQNMEWFRIPPKIFWGPGSLSYLRNTGVFKRAALITDRVMVNLGYVQRAQDLLREAGVQVLTFDDVEPDPSVHTVRRIANFLSSFNPDLIVALGGGSPIDAAKAGWLFYERPEVDFKDVAVRFMDIRKRVFKIPPLSQKAKFIAIPTTSGTGSEVTAYTIITDEKGEKFALADYEFTPWCTIVDSDLVMTLPKEVTAITGLDALSHALEAYVSTMASDYTDPLALQAVRLLFEYLPRAYENPQDREAREKVHNAATIAGMAFTNSGLGICHSLSHKIGSAFHIPHGLANAIFLPHVIRYNSAEVPSKYASWPRYHTYSTRERYAQIMAFVKIESLSSKNKTQPNLALDPEALAEAIASLMQRLGLPPTLKEAGVPKNEFEMQVKELAKRAFDDQCTGTNPRYPLMPELESIYRQAYE
ncbi:bifunctional acetaldehyde-CoA/alcohol dehydrogenase [candidate division NPL-UPA2 bacterium]|nr:bifunctional acetaldehyde-CoA/alcohol dehydrogenase [candidate division NPL-UPA2 bacterium]